MYLYAPLPYPTPCSLGALPLCVPILPPQAAAAANNHAKLVQVVESLRLICRIFYSLNYLDIPEYFEDNSALWFDAFHK